MKINSAILAAALGLGSVSMANAVNYIYYTGSTAARDAVYTALTNGVGFDNNSVTFAGFGSSTPSGCSYMEFSNTASSVPTIVKCEWSGSEAGINDVSTGTQEPFLADLGTAGVTAGANSASPTASQIVSNAVNIAQADNALLYSKLPGSSAVQTSDSLVIPFVFVKNTTTIADQGNFSNITSANFKNLAQGGDVLALFTGNAADQNNFVYLAGRDDNSGTRVNTFGITGWGIKTAPSQIELLNSNLVNFGTVSSPVYQTVEGQSSGGTLAKSLTDTTSSADKINGGTGFIAVAYLGLSDDATAEGLSGGSSGGPSPAATRLTYNGVAYSFNNVENGIYDMWGNEYTDVKSGSASYITTFASKITNPSTGIANNTSGFEIPDSAMNVTRTGPTSYSIY